MKKIVIVGGGVAGLTAGIFAAERGADVSLIEKNKSGAGALCGWRRGGYEIDGCLHWLTGTKEGTELYGIWKKCGVLGDVVKTDALFQSTTDGSTVTFWRDADRWRDETLALSPDDRREILKLYRAVRAAKTLSGVAERPMKRTEAALALAPYALLSAGEVAERFGSAAIRRAICDLTGKSFSSLGLIFAYAAYSSGNGYLPAGGSRGAAERMVKRFQSLDGEYISGVSAEGAERRRGVWRISLSDGRVIEATDVICATDPARGVTDLFGVENFPLKFAKKYAKKEKFPLFSSVHFAFAAKSADVPFKGTSFFPVSRRTHGVSVNRDRMMLREFSHEPAFAPEGMSVLQTMSFTCERESHRWISLSSDKASYEEAKREAAEEVKERISLYYPSLSSVKLIDSWTPATYSKYLGATCGSYMPFALTPATYPASFPARVRGLERVYFASAWNRSPGGVPTAAEAGRRAALSVLG